MIRLSERGRPALFVSRADRRLGSFHRKRTDNQPDRGRVHLLCTLLFTAVVCFSCTTRALPPLPELPEKVGGLRLTGTVRGVEANKVLYRMHGVVTGARNSIVGYYSPDKKNALYLSSFATPDQAERALQKMATKLLNTTAGFTPVTVTEDAGTTLYRTTGMGLNHVFYRQGALVAWWQVEPYREEEILNFAGKLPFTLH